MADSIKVRAQMQGSGAEVRVLINHPMETGVRKDEKGAVVPAHFIQSLRITHNGNAVLESLWGVGISQNPYLRLKLASAKPGDKIAVAWEDNLGKKDATEVTVQ
ncbi:MAG: thiosulfate oxidation carrier complex protein SoxZ [Betaproteobacteria bacterium]|nr:thiosulfate oxidation carrier complex protein SoxZ [Betaproteobacteria bacterium]